MKELLMILVFAILFSGFAMAYDFSAVCESGQTLYYNITSNTEPYTVEVTTNVFCSDAESLVEIKSNYYCGSVNIPNNITYNDIIYSVSSIGFGAFAYCSGLTEITIPNSVTSIDDYAFSGCIGLTSITIPNSVTSIGESAFSGCSGLTEVIIPNSVTNISDWAFCDCSGLASVTIGNGVTSIGNWAFEECSGLTSITIPNSVTRIGNSAFRDCIGLTEIEIPSSIESIGINPFERTGWYNNQPDGMLYLDGWCLGSKGNAPTESIVIAEGTKGIANGALGNCSYTTEIHIPNSLVYFYGNAFMSNAFSSDINTDAYIIVIESSNTNFKIVDDVLFDYDMTKLIMSLRDFNANAYSIPNTVTSIGDYAFSWCGNLTSITIPYSVTSIGNFAFDHCRGLTAIYYTGDVADWCGISFGKEQANPLYYAHNLYVNNELLTNLVIPEMINSIKSETFINATCLTSVSIPNSVTSIGRGAFHGCSGLTSVTIPNSVKNIGGSAFSGCSELTEVTIPNSITSIGACAFLGCSGLTSITIPNSVTRIGESAFYGCSGLTEVIIPNSVTSIGESAFSGCSGLTEVTIPNSVTSIGNYAFSNCRGLTSITIPNYVNSIGGFVFSETGWYNNQPDGILYLDGWCLGYKGDTPSGSLEIANGTKGIAAWALSDSRLTSVNISNSVTKIGEWAFAYCYRLTEVTISNSVEEIGVFAFNGDENLDSISIGNSLENIGYGMLAGCINLTAVSISLSNPIIACNMFTIPGDGTFYGENMRLYVPCGARDAYVASSWSEWFSEITEECPINQISIEIESNGGGNLSLSTTEAAQGDEVLVYVTIDDGYEIDYIIAYNENDPTQTIPITRVDSRYVLTYKIIMPAFPVKIEARFREVSGVEESEIANIGLYPNPVGNTLNITSSETISEIEIVNAMGQVVYRMEVNADNAVCNVEELTNGIYVVRIRTQSQGAEIQRKFIKE